MRALPRSQAGSAMKPKSRAGPFSASIGYSLPRHVVAEKQADAFLKAGPGRDLIDQLVVVPERQVQAGAGQGDAA